MCTYDRCATALAAMPNGLTRRDALKAFTVGGVTVTLAGCEDVEVNLSTQQNTPMPDSHGSMKAGNFEVQIDGEQVPGWQSVTIPAVSIDDGSGEKGVAGQPTYETLRMEREMIDTVLWEWVNDTRLGKSSEFEKPITLRLIDGESDTAIRWDFDNARIVRYEQPELETGASEVASEGVVISFEKFTRTLEEGE